MPSKDKTWEKFRKKLVSIIKKKERKGILDKLQEIKKQNDANKVHTKNKIKEKNIKEYKNEGKKREEREKPNDDPIKVDDNGDFKIAGIGFNSMSNHANGTCLWKILFFKLKNILDNNDDESVYKILSESATEIKINIGDPVYTTKLESLICAINKKLDSKHKIKVKHYNCLHNLTESTLTFVEENLGEEGQIIYVASIANAGSVYGNIHQIGTAGHFVTTLEFNNDKLINPDDWKSYESFKAAINKKKDNKNETKVVKNRKNEIEKNKKRNKKNDGIKNTIKEKNKYDKYKPNKAFFNSFNNNGNNKFIFISSNIKNKNNELNKEDIKKEFQKMESTNINLYYQPKGSKWCVLACILNAANILKAKDEFFENFYKIFDNENLQLWKKDVLKYDLKGSFTTNTALLNSMSLIIGLELIESKNINKEVSEISSKQIQKNSEFNFSNSKCFMFTVENTNSNDSHQILGCFNNSNFTIINTDISGSQAVRFKKNIYKDEKSERKITAWWYIDKTQ